MHQYLTAIGMESVKSKQELDRLLQGLEQENNERAVMSVTADKYDRCEYKKEFAKNIGIAAGGFQDSNGIFEREYIYPYFYGTGITTYADVTVERTKDQQSYIGICEDVKIGVTLMFRIQNYMEYLTGIRMEKAKELLGTTTKKVYEIAGDVGYSDYKYFTAQFKKYTGMSPKDYRLGDRAGR